MPIWWNRKQVDKAKKDSNKIALFTRIQKVQQKWNNVLGKNIRALIKNEKNQYETNVLSKNYEETMF